MSQELMCKWEDFDLNATRIFREIQARSDFCDVKIGCSDSDGKTVKGHRVILASFSIVFEEMFQQLGGNSPVSTTALFLRGVRFHDLTSILNFIYQGEVSVEEERMPSFLSAAEDLKIIGLYKGNSSDEARKRVENTQNIRRSNNQQLKRDYMNMGASRNRVESTEEGINQKLLEYENLKRKSSKLLKQEMLQNRQRESRPTREPTLEEQMNEEDDFVDSTYENMFDSTFHSSNVKSDPDNHRIKNEVVMEPIDTNGILDTLDAHEDAMGMGLDIGMPQNIGMGTLGMENGFPENSGNTDSTQDLSQIDIMHPIGSKTDTNGNTVNKDRSLQAKCKVCGKQERKDKIKRHLIDKHFPHLKPSQTPLSEGEEQGDVPPNFDRNDVEFFDSVGHWDPAWNSLIQKQPLLPYQWIIANAKGWLEYLPNSADLTKSKFRCRICYQYGSVAQRVGENKGWNVFTPLIQEVGDLKSSSESNRNMLRRHAQSDYHKYIFDSVEVKRREAREQAGKA